MEGNGRVMSGKGMVRESSLRRNNNNYSPGRGRGRGRVVVVVGSREEDDEVVTRRQPPLQQSHQMISEQQKKGAVVKVFNKVQVVYYLTRNGQLEHPHFMEVTHLGNQHLRLKDFTDRLTLLRGKGMPSQYSWSCKRSYKNGYVWNDLTDNDIIYPSEGAEYILKGSEIIDRPTTETNHNNNNLKQQQLKLQHSSPLSSTPPPPPPPLDPQPLPLPEEQEEEEDEELLDEEKSSSYTSSNTPHDDTRCSRGVSTTMDDQQLHIPVNGSNRFDGNHYSPQPPPHSINTSSTTTTTVEKRRQQPMMMNQNQNQNCQYYKSGSNTQSFSSRRIVVLEEGTEEDDDDDDDDGVRSSSGARLMSRNSSSSVLLQLIACGGGGSVAAAKKGNGIPCFSKQQCGSKSNCVGKEVGDVDRLRRGVVYKAVVEKRSISGGEEDGQEEEEEKVMIKYMSENPRFGNLQSEEKEYFSGSILEAATTNGGVGHHGWSSHRDTEPTLKKSSSYKEERSCSTKIGGIQLQIQPVMEKEERKNKTLRGKCLPNPRRKSSSSSSSRKNHNNNNTSI